MTEGPDLVLLAADLASAKMKESNAKEARVIAEQALISAFDFQKSEGSETFKKTTERGNCIVSFNQPITTKVDSEGWRKLRHTLPAGHPLRSIFRTKYDLDVKAGRELQENDKESWALVSEVVTRKPGKISVKVDTVSLTFTQQERAE